MNTRQHNLKNMRPEITSATIHDAMSNDERFQNLILRPIIKLQNDLFIEVFKNYIVKHKLMFYNLPIEKRLEYIESALNKDVKFRNSLKGMIIGLFTVEEYAIYIQNSSAINKRMMQIVKERLISNVQLFNQPEEVLKAV
ncbi:glyoxalase [Mariniflexile litorale]|uniref:Glyoxalase n=1 Tax=Mariniflexile litorale TaxID=3045158 RepID=A0AAU7EEP6_9FLAO|nr:glyoxalase [Mariniflexile sp. KMM 9835]MDQ8211450.1 glyoxalase [Mariniflexile sp. KMM 9835]